MAQKILQILGNIVHQLQKERGCVSLYSDSSGKSFSEEIIKQFKQTDIKIADFIEQYQCWKQEKEISLVNLDKLKSCQNNLDDLKNNRQLIVEFEFPTSELINFYTYKIISPLLDIMVKIALFDDVNDPTKVSAYSNLLYWKERTGRERALGMRGFLASSFNNIIFIEKIQLLISEQESYKRTFLALVDSEKRNVIEKMLNQSALRRIEKLHSVIKSNPDSKSLSSMTAEAWYEVMTNKIDLMQEIELLLVNNLSITEEKAKLRQEEFQIEPPKRGISSFNTKHQKFINSLPFFLGIPDDKLSDLLQNAQIKDYKKGQLLFLEGEQAARLYIVLDGWVKLYKGTIAGEETILQMLSSGNTIGESAVFLNSSHPASAQIAENAKLLTIPAPIIREQIRSSTDLAMNMITNMSQHSQSLLHHIESTRLKSTNERVGWFLLKLLLDKDWLIDAVELPYDKSMIASYLDMKPETFSRTLKHFKSLNFKIDNDTVILPDIKALCGFCDIDTALACSKHGTSECETPVETGE